MEDLKARIRALAAELAAHPALDLEDPIMTEVVALITGLSGKGAAQVINSITRGGIRGAYRDEALSDIVRRALDAPGVYTLVLAEEQVVVGYSVNKERPGAENAKLAMETIHGRIVDLMKPARTPNRPSGPRRAREHGPIVMRRGRT